MPKAKQNIIKLIPDETIIRKIYIIRGHKVMLDFDLAVLYEVETKALNQAVKRNAERFPHDFMFRLTQKEWKVVWSQIAASSNPDGMGSHFVTGSKQAIQFQKIGNMRSQIVTGSKKSMRSQIATASQKKRNVNVTPYAFTEHGVTMLASVLKSERAAKMCIAVVRAFIELKKTVLQYDEITKQLQALKEHLVDHDVQLNQIYDAIENLLDEKTEQETWQHRKRIGFK